MILHYRSLNGFGVPNSVPMHNPYDLVKSARFLQLKFHPFTYIDVQSKKVCADSGTIFHVVIDRASRFTSWNIHG
jgi:hypothetical protein